MYQWQPSKWLQLMAVGAGLPFLAAGIIQTKSLVNDVSSRAMTAAAGPKVEFDGRDAFMSGEVASQEALDTARNNVAATYGVRLVDVANLKIVAPPPPAPEPVKVTPVPLMAPTVTAMTTNSTMPMIMGTYPAEAAKLMVSVGATTYTLGTSPELTTDKPGSWMLMPTAALPEGSMDVTAKVESADGTVSAASTPAAIVVDTVAPEAPSMAMAAADAVWPYAITGKWPEMPGNTLAIDFNSKTYGLGKDKELISDGKGLFTFVPTDQLAPGKYDLNLSVTDAAGNVSKYANPAAVIVAAATPAPAPMAELVAPTIDAISSHTGNPVITGTWSPETSKGLTVALGGVTHELGKDGDLTADGGKWTLKAKPYLADGKYDVIVTVTDSAGKTMSDASTNEITIQHPAPPPPPPPAPPKPLAAILTAPTVESVMSENGNPMIMGTWSAAAGQGLSVSVMGTTSVLGKDDILTSDASGNWMLKSHSYLGDGNYDVVARVSDEQGNSRSDATTGELTIKHPAPAPKPDPVIPAPKPILPAPTIVTSVSDSDMPTVKGTWAAGVAKSLTVDLDGVKHKLGMDFDLLTDASGHWTLKPTKPLVNGVYDVVATVTDGDTQSVSDATTGELTVSVAAPPPPPPVDKPYDCEATLARIAAVFPVRFDTDKSDLHAPYDLALNQYAALMNDPRCAAMNVNVAGNADSRGSFKYNQGLSERRSRTVVNVLTAKGIQLYHLNGFGLGENKPLDPSKTEDALRKNRRVEFTVKK